MFNIGVIGCGSVAEVLKLTSRNLPENAFNPVNGRWSEVSAYFTANGQLTVTGVGSVAGEWLSPLRAGAYVDYEIRLTPQNGSAAVIQSSLPKNTWVSMTASAVLYTQQPCYVDYGGAGRMLVEIRKASDHSKIVSAYFIFQ